MPPYEEEFFPIEYPPFWKGFVIHRSKQEVRKVFSYCLTLLHSDCQSCMPFSFGLPECNRVKVVKNIVYSHSPLNMMINLDIELIITYHMFTPFFSCS